ncbi:unnamed protein product [Aphanomyces euteiches]
MDYPVEKMAVTEVAAYCNDFVNNSTAVHHPVETVLSLTAQPSFHRHRLLRQNWESFEKLDIPHAYMCLLTERIAKGTKTFDEYNSEIMATLRDTLPHDEPPTAVQLLEILISRCMPKNDSDLVTLLRFAVLDLALMITKFGDILDKYENKATQHRRNVKRFEVLVFYAYPYLRNCETSTWVP